MSKRIEAELRAQLRQTSPDIQRRHEELERGQGADGGLLRQIVLGGQDGLVNVLGIVLGMASATGSTPIILVSGLAATVAESLSMAAVAYTSSRAEQDHYRAQLEHERREIEEVPEVERKEIELIYYKKGFRGKALAAVVKQITSDKELWLETMMREELRLSESADVDPAREALVVGGASFGGSLIPLVPFALIADIPLAMGASAGLALAVLAAAGAYKARITTGVWWKSALEMMVIGGLAALAGSAVGVLFKVPVA